MILTGNLTSDPVMKQTQNGVDTASMRIAVKRVFCEGTDFFQVTAWRQSAKYAGQYLHKGDKIAVDGTLQTRSWDGKDGTKHWATDINADRIEGLVVAHKGAQNDAGQFVEVDDEPLPWDK